MLDIEPIVPGQGELTSAYRLLSRVCINYPKAFEVVAGDGLYLAGNIFNLLRSHRKYAIAVLKDEKRELYEEVVALSGIVELITYTNDKTTYRVWEHKIKGLWGSYKKEVTVIRSEETKVVGYIEEKADWMWVTNLPSTGNFGKSGTYLPQPVADREPVLRRNSKYMGSRPYIPAQRKCRTCLYPVSIYCCKYSEYIF